MILNATHVHVQGFFCSVSIILAFLLFSFFSLLWLAVSNFLSTRIILKLPMIIKATIFLSMLEEEYLEINSIRACLMIRSLGIQLECQIPLLLIFGTARPGVDPNNSLLVFKGEVLETSGGLHVNHPFQGLDSNRRWTTLLLSGSIVVEGFIHSMADESFETVWTWVDRLLRIHPASDGRNQQHF